MKHPESGGQHLIVGIVLAELVPGQNAFGEFVRLYVRELFRPWTVVNP